MNDTDCPLSPALVHLLQAAARRPPTLITKKLARRTGLEPHTIDAYFERICKQLSVDSRDEALLMALAEGWVALERPGGARGV